MGNVELKIDGEVIVLTSQQTEQFKRAIKKETSVLPARQCGGLRITHKPCGTKSAYPLVISSSLKLTSQWGCPPNHYGYDLSLSDVVQFIKALKEEAAKVWSTAAKELKSV